MTDTPARQAILEELHANFLVEASAGSGKTHSLASRIVRGIVDGVYEVDRVAAVTFTRKAAAELRGRIRLALESAGAADALARFDQLFVGTVHSFCAHLLRQYPLEAGISPGFLEVTESDDIRILQQCLRSGWEEPEGRKLLLLLAEFDCEPADLWPALECLAGNGEVDYPSAPVQPPVCEPVWTAVDEFRRFLTTELPEVEERQPTCKILLAGRRLCQQASSAERDRLRDLLRILNAWERELAPIKRYWGSNRSDQNARLAEVTPRLEEFRIQVVRPFLECCRSYLYGECLPFLLRIRQRSQQERTKLGLVNFQDLLLYTVQMLRQHETVRERLQERFGHLLVDEFQDTDPLQSEIFLLLAGPGRDWKEVVPRPGSLFLVGDPKQSIYRFRRADMRTYQAVRQWMLERGGRAVSLETSFRSRPALCQWLNGAFSSILPSISCDKQAHFSALTPCLPDSPQTHVFRLAASSVPEEAEQIAAWIQSLVFKTQTHVFADFLILTARKAELRDYQRALERLQIPCEAPVERGPLGRRAASLLPLLRHLADPQDKAILVGVLRGPLFGHSDEELFLHVQAAGTLRPYLQEKGLPTVSASLERLNAWRLAVRWLPPGAAISWLMEESGLLSLAAAEGQNSLAQLRGMLDSMRRNGEAGLTLAQAVAELAEKGAVELPSSRCGQKDAVRVMNVHKAKGLEARVVFLAAPLAGFSLTADHVLNAERQGFLCLRKFRKLLAHPPGWQQLEVDEIASLKAEQLRFLYVAATRARETLVVGVPRGGGRPWQPLEPFLEGCPDFPKEQAWIPEPTLARLLSEVERAELHARREARQRPSWQRGSIAVRAVGSQLKPTLPADAVHVDARDWGHLVHRLLEHLVRQPDLSRDKLWRLGRWICFDVPGLLQVLPAALDVLEQIKKSLLWDWLEDASQRLVEVPFGVRHQQRILFGTIDLAMRRQDGWGVIDYKTDRQRLDTLVSHYARQVEQYARSWSQVTAEPLRYSGLFAVREGRLSPDLTPPQKTSSV